jgi:hypothetical protein
MGLRTLTATALAAGVLTLGSGCLTPDAHKAQANRPDVTQPGVLPPPQGAQPRDLRPQEGNAVVPAGGIPAGEKATGSPVVPAAGSASLPKIANPFERKIPASEMGLAWRNRIAHLPDPARQGAPGPGVVGQLFLVGGPKQTFVEADGILTVDLTDESPRPAGQQGAKPERWQFNKEMLKNLRTLDETWGQSYVLFLPWRAYKSDITRIKISARYDQPNGPTLYSQPTVITLDKTPHGAPVWDGTTTSSVVGGGPDRPLPSPGMPNGPQPNAPFGLNPISLGGPQPAFSAPPAPAMQPIPLSPAGPPAPTGSVPLGPVPVAPPSGLEPITLTIGK